jgi:hypothetical protein
VRTLKFAIAEAKVPEPFIRTSVFGWPDVPVISGCELVSVLRSGDGGAAGRLVVVVVVSLELPLTLGAGAGACPGDGGCCCA